MSKMRMSLLPSNIIVGDTVSKIEIKDLWGWSVAFVLIDTEDVDKVRGYKWSLSTGYAYSGGHGKENKLEYLLLGAPPFGMIVDHINRNRLDCRKSQLRFATDSQNTQNSDLHGESSKYRGVCWCKACNKWASRIRPRGYSWNLGYFVDEKEAAKAYNAAALVHYGPQAALNAV